MTGGFAKVQEKKDPLELEKVRHAFRDPNLRGWIPKYRLTILEYGPEIITMDNVIFYQLRHFQT